MRADTRSLDYRPHRHSPDNPSTVLERHLGNLRLSRHILCSPRVRNVARSHAVSQRSSKPVKKKYETKQEDVKA